MGPCVRRDDEDDGALPRSRSAFRPGFAFARPSSNYRGRREDRVPACTRGPSRKKLAREGAKSTGERGITPAFPAQWFTAYFALSPVNQLDCHRRFAPLRAKLSACMGAPGPHDFAVRENPPLVVRRPSRPPHSAPRSWRRVRPSWR